MKKYTAKIAAFLTAATCSAGLTSCGRDVPTVENSGGEFSIAGGIDGESSLENELEATIPDYQEAAVSETTTAVTEPVSTETTTVKIAIVTRSKEELDKLAAATKTAAARPVSTKPAATTPAPDTNQSGNNNSGGNASSTKPANNSGGNGASTTIPGGNTASTTPSGSGTVSGINLSYYSAEIDVGKMKSYPVVAEIIPEVWTSSDPYVATVDIYGNITGVSV
ncbi:MAG: hypothetical protein K2J37_00720, partial [Ruminococcus sp.]|nr:hypothetical protein [Ruminococcus sp.]